MDRILATVLAAAMFFSPNALASSAPTGEEPLFRLIDEPERPRSVFWAPLFSFFLPGFDQWWEGQTGAASVYTGTALLAGSLESIYAREVVREQRTAAYRALSEAERVDRDTFGEQQRRYAFASQVQMAAGSFSAYHAFRSAAETQKSLGRFGFLSRAETPKDIFLAPFKFEYLSRMTTIVPLAVAGTMGLLTTFATDKSFAKAGLRKRHLNRSDYFYSGAVSTAAGTHEEVLFRGWLMPVLRDATGSDLWSNALSSAVFAAAHLNTVAMPVFQLTLGAHLAYVTQRNDWTLSESVFIHTWWDVFALLAAYQIRNEHPSSGVLPVLWLPALDIVF